MGLAIALLLAGADPATTSPPSAPVLAPIRFDLHGLDAPPAALAIERDYLGLAPQPCLTTNPGEIVVCARRSAPARSQRLPLPDLRYENGEVVRHPDEAPGASLDIGHSCVRPGSCEPSRLMDTLIGAASSLIYTIKGEDRPVPPIP